MSDQPSKLHDPQAIPRDEQAADDALALRAGRVPLDE